MPPTKFCFSPTISFSPTLFRPPPLFCRATLSPTSPPARSVATTSSPTPSFLLSHLPSPCFPLTTTHSTTVHVSPPATNSGEDLRRPSLAPPPSFPILPRTRPPHARRPLVTQGCRLHVLLLAVRAAAGQLHAAAALVVDQRSLHDHPLPQPNPSPPSHGLLCPS